MVVTTGAAGSSYVDMRVCEHSVHPPTASSSLSAGTRGLKEHLCNVSSVLSSSRCHICALSSSVFFKVSCLVSAGQESAGGHQTPSALCNSQADGKK